MKGLTRLLNKSMIGLLLVLGGMTPGVRLRSEEPSRDGDWLLERDEATGVTTFTMEVTLYPRSEPRPALKYRLVPDDFDLLEGNAAIYYLKAMGFLEQTRARELVNAYHEQARQEGEEKRWETGQMRPWRWMEMPPEDLPVDEVKSYLDLLAFQQPFLEEARKLRTFSLDRNIRQVESPATYLLPEIQAMRGLARTQSMRCRLAIAENRIDDATQILGQQIAMAKHLGGDEFIVSTLVGAAIHGIAWTDALYLLQHPETPNLYWALASLPTPLIDMRRAMAYERQFLYEQTKMLRDVDEVPKPVGYWQHFLDEIAPHLDGLSLGLHGQRSFGDDPQGARAALATYVAAAYPGAKRYLLEDGQIPYETIEAYPTAQTVFLATKKFYERARDDHFKWNLVPFSEGIAEWSKVESQLQKDAERIGWLADFVTQLLPKSEAIRTVQARAQQGVTMLQTVEAIRAYGAEHHGELPTSLGDVSLPVPRDPFSGEWLTYERNGPQATLSGRANGGIRHRVILRLVQE